MKITPKKTEKRIDKLNELINRGGECRIKCKRCPLRVSFHSAMCYDWKDSQKILLRAEKELNKMVKEII